MIFPYGFLLKKNSQPSSLEIPLVQLNFYKLIHVACLGAHVLSLLFSGFSYDPVPVSLCKMDVRHSEMEMSPGRFVFLYIISIYAHRPPQII